MYVSTKHRNDGAAWAAMAGLTKPRVLRRIMNNVTDGLLLDVREVSITDLEFADEESALNRALQRILTSNTERSFNSFGSSI
jgi:hypothetical protein